VGSDRGDEVLRYIAANVRQARIRKRLTQEALAERAELDLSYLQRVEGAKMNASALKLASLARALGMEAWELLRPTDAVPPRGRGRPIRKAPGA
jgi:transcriptional regulator with XRE-family HTH domain